MVVVTPAYSTVENQIAWLFGVQDQLEMKFEVREISPDTRDASDFVVRYILEGLGLEPEEPETGHLDEMLNRFGETLPSTRIFSEFARSKQDDISARDDPDAALMVWMETEVFSSANLSGILWKNV